MQTRETDHRVRLTDSDLDIVVAALRARLPMSRGARRKQTERLIARLAEMAPGNPAWRLSLADD